MSSTIPKRIDIKVNEYCRNEEFRAGGIVKPGHLVKVNSDNEGVVHATSGGPAELWIALEDAKQGKTINDAYAEGDLIHAIRPLPGDVVFVRIPAAATALIIGDFMMSNGDGSFAKRTSTNEILLVAAEAKDNSGGGAEVFVRARVYK